jgi:protein TonB
MTKTLYDTDFDEWTSTTRWLCLFLCISASAFGQGPSRIRVAHLASKVDSIYPAAAKRKRIEGTVRFDAVIGKDGHVANINLIKGNPVLLDAAKNAVMQWVYTPTLFNGEPIEVVMEVGVPFVLGKTS